MEHLKPLLEHEESMDLLGFAAAALAEARVPAPIARALTLCKMTALQKRGSEARGIAAGGVFRWLVTRARGRQFAEQFAVATAPFQLTLPTRAGADRAAALPRSVLDREGDAVIVGIDGTRAFDCASRSAFVHALRARPALASLAPFAQKKWRGQGPA